MFLHCLGSWFCLVNGMERSHDHKPVILQVRSQITMDHLLSIYGGLLPNSVCDLTSL